MFRRTAVRRSRLGLMVGNISILRIVKEEIFAAAFAAKLATALHRGVFFAVPAETNDATSQSNQIAFGVRAGLLAAFVTDRLFFHVMRSPFLIDTTKFCPPIIAPGTEAFPLSGNPSEYCDPPAFPLH
jgi:hypothetical protein